MGSEHQNFDSQILIIGGGIAGLSTAYYLTKLNVSCAVIDANEVGRGATWAAAGMLCPTHELEFQELELLASGVESRELYKEWATELGEIGLEQQGALEIALTADDVPYLERFYQFQQQQGLAVDWLDSKTLHAMHPYLGLEVAAGIFARQDGQVDNRLLVNKLKAYLQRNGVRFWEQAAIAAVQMNAPYIIATDNTGNIYKSDKVLWASGIHGPRQGDQALKDIYPIKGQMIALASDATIGLNIPIRIRSRQFGNAYIVPKQGRILLGSTAEEQGRTEGLTAGGMLDILRKCYAAVPSLYDLRVLDSWSGFRPASYDRKPQLVEHTAGRIFSLNGLYRHGILLGPLMGKEMANWMVQGVKPSRFSWTIA